MVYVLPLWTELAPVRLNGVPSERRDFEVFTEALCMCKVALGEIVAVTFLSHGRSDLLRSNFSKAY